MARGWDQGGVAGWFRYEKTVLNGGVLAIGGRRGAVGKCDRMRVTLQVL